MVTNDWNQQTVQCWWFNWKNNLRTLPGTARLTKSFHIPHIVVTYIPRISDLPFLPVCFRALKTLGTEKPANPDFRFLFHCTDTQKYFSKYVLRTINIILLVPTLMGLVLFLSPCLLQLPCFFRYESDCTHTSYRYVKGLSTDDVLTGSTVTKINITFITCSLLEAH
jgi:hypothetical protein